MGVETLLVATLRLALADLYDSNQLNRESALVFFVQISTTDTLFSLPIGEELVRTHIRDILASYLRLEKLKLKWHKNKMLFLLNETATDKISRVSENADERTQPILYELALKKLSREHVLVPSKIMKSGETEKAFRINKDALSAKIQAIMENIQCLVIQSNTE